MAGDGFGVAVTHVTHKDRSPLAVGFGKQPLLLLLRWRRIGGPFDAQPFDAQPFDAQPFDAQPFDAQRPASSISPE